MAEKTFLNDWQSVDQSQAAGQYSSYLDDATRLVHTFKQQSFDLLNPELGHEILDVGCGNGDDVRALAQRVGPEGSVVGIDTSQELVTTAQNHPDNAQLPVTFEVGDAYDLAFEDNRFHSCRSDRVFQHLSDRERALKEMIRVTRSGGCIAITDPDWETLVVDVPSHEALTRKILNYITDHASVNGWAGRNLYRLLKQAGLVEIDVIPGSVILTDFSVAGPIYHLESAVQEMVEEGELSADEAGEWLGYLRQADETGYFFSSMTGFMACGQKPCPTTD